MRNDCTTLAKKNRYSRDIHEIDLQCDHLISCDIDFDLQRELATRRGRESRRCRAEARYRTISHDRTVDQTHEFLGCNDFLGQGSSMAFSWIAYLDLVSTVNYRYNVTDGTLKKLRYIRFLRYTGITYFLQNIQNCVISVNR